MTDENVNKISLYKFYWIIFYFFNWFVNFKTHKKIITNIIIYILKVSYLIDYKSSFKCHQQFKTNTIYIYKCIRILHFNRKLEAKRSVPQESILFLMGIKFKTLCPVIRLDDGLSRWVNLDLISCTPTSTSTFISK